MPLAKLTFRPGINRETTSYANEGGWRDGDKIRFRFGFPEKIGGWQKLSGRSFLGTARALHPWTALDGTTYAGVGTHLKYYLEEGGGFNDITPVRLTTAAGDATFATGADTLAEDFNPGDNSLVLNDASDFPPSGLVKVNDEMVRYSSITTNALTGLTRGVNGTTVASHSTGDDVGCATVQVTENNHGALVNDFVIFSGASSLGGALTADILNQQYLISTIVSDSTYLIEAREVAIVPDITADGEYAPTYVFSTTSDTGNGGGSVVAEYLINSGLDSTVGGTGWGAGLWGRSTWGSAANLTASGARLRIWSHDNFGEDLLINVRDGGIYYWDKSGGTGSRAVALDSLSGSNLAPTVAKQVLVSDRDRHVIAFGCDGEASIGTQDPMLIRFSDQENLLDWESTATNTAGELRLGSGSEIVTAVETRQQILVFTDTALYAMQYLGPPFTFGINLISEAVTMRSPLAAIAVEDQVFWMGQTEFYVYNGAVQRLPCSVRDYVFDDFNETQAEKVTAALNSENSEVWWFYPSAGSEENDRYVVYNYLEKVWYYGTLSRTVWVDRGVNDLPIAASPDGYLYYHEIGFDDGSTSPESAIPAYIESSPVDLGDGEQFMFIRRMLMDLKFRNSTAEAPAVNVEIRVRNFSGGNYRRTQTFEFDDETEIKHLRLRGRQASLKVSSDALQTTWRMGSPRLDMRPDGRR